MQSNPAALVYTAQSNMCEWFIEMQTDRRAIKLFITATFHHLLSTRQSCYRFYGPGWWENFGFSSWDSDIWGHSSLILRTWNSNILILMSSNEKHRCPLASLTKTSCVINFVTEQKAQELTDGLNLFGQNLLLHGLGVLVIRSAQNEVRTALTGMFCS